MIFPSHIFLLLFLPAVLLGWYGLRSVRLRFLFLTFGSYLFYSWWDYRFSLLMLGSTLLDYFCGRQIYRCRMKGTVDSSSHAGRSYLVASIVGNLCCLGFFKYYDFFAQSLHAAMGSLGLEAPLPVLHIVLPIGISFYTFQSMSYSIDIYRDQCRPARDVVSFAAFVSFFPQLVAGPIVRFADIESQFERLGLEPVSFERIADGIWLFVIGLMKKLWIADSLAPLVSRAFDSEGPVQFTTAWVGTIGFTFQLYFDFSGYSDMARGLGNMMGFSFPVNFNSPYKSANIAAFWRRWHITLSNWLRDYLYIPLGGSRVASSKTVRNLGITLILGGLWHGAAWQFVAWGLYHAWWLSLHSLWRRKVSIRLPQPICVAGTFLLVSGGWVLFRSPSIQDAVGFYKAMIGLNGLEPLIHYSSTLGIYLPAIYGDFGGAHGCLFLALVALIVFKAPNSQDLAKSRHPAFAALIATAVIVMLTSFETATPFLYYQF